MTHGFASSRWLVVVTLSSLTLWAACEKEKEKNPVAAPGASTAKVATLASSVATTSESAQVVPSAHASAVEVQNYPASAAPTPMPAVAITAPAMEQEVGDSSKALDFEVKLDVKHWDLGKGQTHVHLILDNQPYKPIYDAKAPVKLRELLPKDGKLDEGHHVLVAFPSRATHESVKEKGTSVVCTFWVGKKGKPTIELSKPHLIFSRPKGDNLGDMAKGVLIDFYLLNSTLSQGERVQYTLSGPGISTPLQGAFSTWAPKVIRHLHKGTYEVSLKLVDKEGKLIPGPFNSVTRTFKADRTVKHDPAMGVAVDHSNH